jgi:chromosome segregation ATPase
LHTRSARNGSGSPAYPQAALLRQISDMKEEAANAMAEVKSKLADATQEIAGLKKQLADGEALNASLVERVAALSAHFDAIGSMACQGIKAATLQAATPGQPKS